MSSPGLKVCVGSSPLGFHVQTARPATQASPPPPPLTCQFFRSVRTLALDCMRQLLVWPGLREAAQQPALCALLAAFHKDAPLQLEGEAGCCKMCRGGVVGGFAGVEQQGRAPAAVLAYLPTSDPFTCPFIIHTSRQRGGCRPAHPGQECVDLLCGSRARA